MLSILLALPILLSPFLIYWVRFSHGFRAAFGMVAFLLVGNMLLNFAGLAPEGRVEAWVGFHLTAWMLWIPPLLVIEPFLRGKSPLDRSFFAALFFSAMMVSLPVVLIFLLKSPLRAPLEAWYQVITEKLYTWMSQNSGQAMEASLADFRLELLKQLPTELFLFCFGIQGVSLLSLYVVKKELFQKALQLGPVQFALWKTPEKLIWFAIFSGLMLFFPNYTAAYALGINGLNVITPFYLLHGLSISFYLFTALKLPRRLQVTFFVLGLLFLKPVLLALGFGDLWFDFRSKIRQP